MSTATAGRHGDSLMPRPPVRAGSQVVTPGRAISICAWRSVFDHRRSSLGRWNEPPSLQPSPAHPPGVTAAKSDDQGEWRSCALSEPRPTEDEEDQKGAKRPDIALAFHELRIWGLGVRVSPGAPAFPLKHDAFRARRRSSARAPEVVSHAIPPFCRRPRRGTRGLGLVRPWNRPHRAQAASGRRGGGERGKAAAAAGQADHGAMPPAAVRRDPALEPGPHGRYRRRSVLTFDAQRFDQQVAALEPAGVERHSLVGWNVAPGLEGLHRHHRERRRLGAERRARAGG
jgi:hypothetical protein